MKTKTKAALQPVAVETDAPEETKPVHPLMRSYTLVSNRHVDYNNLTAFEAISMTAVLVLAVLAGTVASMGSLAG